MYARYVCMYVMYDTAFWCFRSCRILEMVLVMVKILSRSSWLGHFRSSGHGHVDLTLSNTP